ncbi:MAG: endolytic transglycosylase MltG [Corynebacterium sp.]|uniref:endolytic transglycosylase MltG n=1 Tax=unclassified Corynebacterium TaxID=2624378 RepID=UPI002649C284|nr:endolytic transglycosylase MltG [Corynebacterium sp.]MDN5582507.1 endolytic transglycosylase MltG [Corynebacterium sp.]MDN5719914.1 endolytic transglycosylase MltG [Corynebacterium sp.]MDN6326114.1 endolytic transglycosylase MltG [Corynebacterium sp.]
MPRKISTEPRYRRRRQWSIAISLALILLLVFVVAYVYYQREVVGTRDYEGEGNGNVVLVRVDEGDTVSGLLPQLLEDNVVGSRSAMLSAADHAEQNGDTRGLEAGYYALQEEMSAEAAMTALTDDERRLGVIDIPNGLTLEDVTVVGGEAREGIYSAIAGNSCREGLTDGLEDCVSVDDLRETVATTPADELGVPEWAVDAVEARGDDARRVEGLISPGVHLFDPTAGPQEIMNTLLEDSAEVYEGTGLLEASDSVGLSPYDMITAASLVEREAPEGDFDKVARVILNRLDEDQQLEFDSTVNYDVSAQEVATTDEDRARNTPWNTYAKKGLPDTPIASPGITALQSVEHPADGDWLYFVTVDTDGRTVFNREFSDHEAAIEESRRNGVLDSAR